MMFEPTRSVSFLLLGKRLILSHDQHTCPSSHLRVITVKYLKATIMSGNCIMIQRD
ncbi:hypothetical protein Hanom_Chr02g00102671 [Helianthus anomalus]